MIRRKQKLFYTFMHVFCGQTHCFERITDKQISWNDETMYLIFSHINETSVEIWARIISSWCIHSWDTLDCQSRHIASSTGNSDMQQWNIVEAICSSSWNSKQLTYYMSEMPDLITVQWVHLMADPYHWVFRRMHCRLCWNWKFSSCSVINYLTDDCCRKENKWPF